MYEINFDVSGAGRFPIDMLRYDRCHPTTQTDVDNIESGHLKIGRRSVNLTANSATKQTAIPCEGRWDSFGWRVANVKVRKV